MKKIPIIEAGLSLVSIWWAIIMFTNDNLFDNVPSLFTFFVKISQEKGWGLFFLCAAFIKLLGLVLEHRKLRIIGLYMSAFIYSLISAGYILSQNPMQPGTGIHFVLMIFAFYAIREVKEYGTVTKSGSLG